MFDIIISAMMGCYWLTVHAIIATIRTGNTDTIQILAISGKHPEA